jgi:hypothetical protein
MNLLDLEIINIDNYANIAIFYVKMLYIKVLHEGFLIEKIFILIVILKFLKILKPCTIFKLL